MKININFSNHLVKLIRSTPENLRELGLVFVW